MHLKSEIAGEKMFSCR